MKVKRDRGNVYVSLLGNRVIVARYAPMWNGRIPAALALSISDGDPESDDILSLEINKRRLFVRNFRRTILDIHWGW
jgi:hypothetical protein